MNTSARNVVKLGFIYLKDNWKSFSAKLFFLTSIQLSVGVGIMHLLSRVNMSGTLRIILWGVFYCCAVIVLTTPFMNALTKNIVYKEPLGINPFQASLNRDTWRYIKFLILWQIGLVVVQGLVFDVPSLITEFLLQGTSIGKLIPIIIDAGGQYFAAYICMRASYISIAILAGQKFKNLKQMWINSQNTAWPVTKIFLLGTMPALIVGGLLTVVTLYFSFVPSNFDIIGADFIILLLFITLLLILMLPDMLGCIYLYKIKNEKNLYEGSAG